MKQSNKTLKKLPSPKAIQDYLIENKVPSFKVFTDDTVSIYQPDVHFNHFKEEEMEVNFPTDKEKALESAFNKVLTKSFDIRKHFAYPPSRSLGFYMAVVTYDGIFYCNEPKVHIKQDKQLHSITGKAIEFEDGWGLYYINGVYFDEELFNKITNNKLTTQEIELIPDLDQRREATKLTTK